MAESKTNGSPLRRTYRKVIASMRRRILYSYQKKDINENLIVMESEGDFSDNAYALYEYLKDNGYLKKYKVVWLVNNVKAFSKEGYENTVFIRKYPRFLRIRWSRYLGTCKYYIYTHNNVLRDYKSREGRQLINLWHGCAFKSGKGYTIDGSNEHTYPDMIFTTGTLFRPVFKTVFGCQDEVIKELGYSRNDYLFRDYTAGQTEFLNDKLAGFNKRLLWMPTFRRSVSKDLDETYFDSTTGLPLIDDRDKLVKFNDYLKEQNAVCVFKLHHLQSEQNVFEESYSNIFVLRDEDIKKSGLQLYQILPMFDSLITDYSSVATDYMLLDRPIIFTVDDYDSYKSSRGFLIEDPIQYFAGHCVKAETEFYEAVGDVTSGRDPYKDKRHELMDEFHEHQDGGTSKRIVELLKL